MDASLNGPFGRLSLSPDALTIGRIASNKLVLNDTKASSRHAEIRPEGNGYAIIDVGSTNGTFVNEQQLRPNEPRQLQTGDTIRIGDTSFSYESSEAPHIDPTVYAEKGATPVYDPTVAVPPPAQSANTAYGAELPNNQPYVQNPPPPVQPAYGQAPLYPPPPAPPYGQPDGAYLPPQPAPPYGYPPAIPPKRSNRTLFVILGSVVGGIILLCILVSVVVYAARSTPEKTLTAYCDALKSGDYQTAYNQYSLGIQRQVNEAQFASAFSAVKITGCTVSNTSDDGTVGLGTMSYTTNTSVSGIDDFRLIQESGVWKINNETARK